MSRIVSPLGGVFMDLMGCEEDDVDCIKDAKKYAAAVVYGTIIIIVAVIAYKGHRMLKA